MSAETVCSSVKTYPPATCSAYAAPSSAMTKPLALAGWATAGRTCIVTDGIAAILASWRSCPAIIWAEPTHRYSATSSTTNHAAGGSSARNSTRRCRSIRPGRRRRARRRQSRPAPTAHRPGRGVHERTSRAARTPRGPARRRRTRAARPHRRPVHRPVNEHAAAKAELETLTATQPVADDSALIEELPYAPELLDGAPAELRGRIYAAFQVHALYRAPQHQATITATVTDQTPGLIAALLDDPRTRSRHRRPQP
jgi:hypothetical protein